MREHWNVSYISMLNDMRYKLCRQKPEYLAAVELLSNNTKIEITCKFIHVRFEIATNGWLDSHLQITLMSTLFMDKQRTSPPKLLSSLSSSNCSQEGSCWKGIVKYFSHYQESTECNLYTASVENKNNSHTPADLSLSGTYQGPWWSWWRWPDSTAREKAPWCGHVSSSNPTQN